jgi:hypothetical protein
MRCFLWFIAHLTIIFLSLDSNTVLAQLNITVQETDPLIQYTPTCPVDQQVCNGGWTHFFMEGTGNTIGYKETFAPGVEFGFVLPQVTFTFRGTAIYWLVSSYRLLKPLVFGLFADILLSYHRFTVSAQSIITSLFPSVDPTFFRYYGGIRRSRRFPSTVHHQKQSILSPDMGLMPTHP